MKRHTLREIIERLRQADAMISRGSPIADAASAIGVTAITYYRWRKKYGGLGDDQIAWIADLQKEIAGLRKSVAELQVDKLILAAVSQTLLQSPAKRRAYVAHVKAELGVSERRACQVLGQHRSTQRKTPKLQKRVPGKALALHEVAMS